MGFLAKLLVTSAYFLSLEVSEMASRHRPDPTLIHIRDAHVRGMAAQTEANAMSTMRVRDIEASRSSEEAAKKLRTDGLLAVLLISAVFIAFVLFMLTV